MEMMSVIGQLGVGKVVGIANLGTAKSMRHWYNIVVLI